ncbi:MAG: hypothetical protein ACM3O3_03115 [Syntrophothermus sp.]
MKIFLQNTKSPIVIILLAVFVFTFLHSELGFLTYDQDHSNHDHCTIVNSSSTPSQNINVSPVKQKIEYLVLCLNILDGSLVYQLTTTNNNESIFKRETIKVYLHNQTFLI